MFEVRFRVLVTEAAPEDLELMGVVKRKEKRRIVISAQDGKSPHLQTSRAADTSGCVTVRPLSRKLHSYPVAPCIVIGRWVLRLECPKYVAVMLHSCRILDTTFAELLF